MNPTVTGGMLGTVIGCCVAVALQMILNLSTAVGAIVGLGCGMFFALVGMALVTSIVSHVR